MFVKGFSHGVMYGIENTEGKFNVEPSGKGHVMIHLFYEALCRRLNSMLLT